MEIVYAELLFFCKQGKKQEKIKKSKKIEKKG